MDLVKCHGTCSIEFDLAFNRHASSESKGERLGLVASDFDLLPRPRFVNSSAAFLSVGNSHIVATLRYVLGAKTTFLIGNVVAINVNIAAINGHQTDEGVGRRAVCTDDMSSDFDSLHPMHGDIGLCLFASSDRDYLRFRNLSHTGVI